MKSIKLTIESLVRRVNAKIRVGPSQMFRSTECRWLIMVDDILLCPESGRQEKLELSDSELRDDQDIDVLVNGAKQLCQGDERPLGLLLPLSQFLYSHYSIQLGDDYLGEKEMVHSSIALQKDILLPAFDQEFALGAAVGRPDGVAFWLPMSVLHRLEAGFGAAGLELIAVMPRALAAAPDTDLEDDYVIADMDSSSCTVLEIEGKVATRVLSAFWEEFENKDIKEAWDLQTKPLLEKPSVGMSSAEDWLKLHDVKSGLSDYLFFTSDFLRQVNGRNRQMQIWAGGAAAVAAMVILSIPILYQWVDTIRLERAREEFRAQASVAAEYQNEILDMEYEWGVLYEYPEADVAGILMALNTVIDNSLTSFSLTDSTVEIQGFTQDPEQLTRLLVEQPLFEDEQPLFETIEQSRSISDSNSGRGDRFGLRMTLSGLDYLEYSRKYDFR